MKYEIKEIDGEPVIDLGAVSDGYVYIGKISNCVFENNVYHVLYDTGRGNVKYHDVLHIPLDDTDEDTKKMLDKIIKMQEGVLFTPTKEEKIAIAALQLFHALGEGE